MAREFCLSTWTEVYCWPYRNRYVSGPLNEECCFHILEKIVKKAKQNNVPVIFADRSEWLLKDKRHEAIIIKVMELTTDAYLLRHPRSFGGSWDAWDNWRQKQCNQVTIE